MRNIVGLEFLIVSQSNIKIKGVRNMDKNVYLKKYKVKGEKVKLIYQNGTSLFVRRTDFDRAFQCMVTCPKSEIKRDFAISRWSRV